MTPITTYEWFLLHPALGFNLGLDEEHAGQAADDLARLAALEGYELTDAQEYLEFNASVARTIRFLDTLYVSWRR